MPPQPHDAPDHVYQRPLDPHRRSSLSVLAQRIPPGAKVLDLGIGGGALGNHLALHKRCTVHGVTVSAQEAAQALPGYARLERLDLEQPDWWAPLDTDYDVVVCADVLEHLRQPEPVLRDIHRLLAPQGLLLVSVPNAGYAGFITELMHGNLDYGDEGLLDRTHLRFFTRRSFSRLLGSTDWQIEWVDTVEQPWLETEFHRPFDSLPPAVARHLLALPDASAYQLLFAARREAAVTAQPAPSVTDRPFIASYIAVLFFGDEAGFHPGRFATTMARVGEHGQTLRFAFPPGQTVTRLRLDPADRPGFFRLRAMRLRDQRQQPLWQWQADAAGMQALRASARHQVEFGTPTADDPCLPLLMTGDDPQIELPIAPALLASDPSVLEVVCDWPLSADYQAALRDRQTGAAVPHPVGPPPPPPPPAPEPAATPAPPGSIGPRWWQRLFGPPGRPAIGPTPAPVPTPDLDPLVRVVVPVYGNLPLVRRCVESVLASSCITRWQLVLIDDASPGADIAPWMQAFAQTHPEAMVLRNGRNLGFVQTVNLGMRLAGRGDVVLLNSDAEVAGDWLDRLRRAAWSAPNVASVTPFSNNATICSWPGFCADNPLPAGEDTASLHRRFAQANAGQTVDIPTAVGFCMYLRRDAIDAVGLFDAESFGAGYGEENDWCMRTLKRGWRHLHALDVFVRHEGGASFSERREALQRSAAQALLRLHPDYDERVRAFVQQDPAAAARRAVLEHMPSTPRTPCP